MKKYFFILALLLLPSLASATTYFVSFSGGNDNNNGTSSNTPWKTITKVNAQKFVPGDNILFNRGETWVTGALNVPTSGSAGNYITYGAYGSGAKPKFNGNAGNDGFGLFQIRGKSWIIVENLEIFNMNAAVFVISSGAAPVTDVIVRNCHVHTNLTASNMFVVANWTEGTITPLVEGRMTNILIENNEIRNSGHNTLIFNGGVTNSMARGNLIYDYGHNGIDIKGANSSTARNRNISLINNRIIGTPARVSPPQTGIFGADTANLLVDGNVISGNGDSNIKSHQWQTSPPITNVGPNIYQRNIVYGSTGGVGIHIGGNISPTLFNNTYNNNNQATFFNANTGTTTRVNDLAFGNISQNTTTTNPRWADPANGDFRLCTGVGAPLASCTQASPFINAGTNVGLPFNGSAPDFGALESGQSGGGGGQLPPAAPTNLAVK